MNPPPISLEERRHRLTVLEAAMEAQGIAACLIDATSSLRYFTGLSWHASERLTGAVVRPGKPLTYITPRFELDKVASIIGVPGEILTWEEHENPFRLVADTVGPNGRVAVDEQARVFIWLGLAEALGADRLTGADPLIVPIRARKSATEIALMTRAKALTLEAHRRAHGSLEAGVRASEVVGFIDRQHRALGADGGNTFCIVSFGADTSLPHGGEGDPELKDGDFLLPSQNLNGTDWALGDNGVTLAGEVHYHLNHDASEALPGVYKLGGFYLTGEFEDLASPVGAKVKGNGMLWLLAEQMLYRDAPGSSRNLSAFGSLVFSLTDQVNKMSNYFNAGLVYQGLFPARPRDKTGLGITAGWYASQYNDGLQAAGLAEKDCEAVVELNHLFLLGHGIGIQPDLQYIIRPAGTGDIDNALVIGAKVTVQF